MPVAKSKYCMTPVKMHVAESNITLGWKLAGREDWESIDPKDVTIGDEVDFMVGKMEYNGTLLSLTNGIAVIQADCFYQEN